jgi:hypothetical protein
VRLLLVVVAGLGLVQGKGERPVLERPGVVELTLPERTARVEHFRLDDPTGDRATPVGIARLYRIPDPAGGVRLEWETRFFQPAVRVLAVERLAHDSIGLVWRELGGRGRTVHVAWDPASGAVEAREAGGAAIRRREHNAGDGLFTPLFLLEQMRCERLSAGVFRRLDPATGESEPLRFEAQPALQPFAPALRYGVWRRADGSLAGAYLLRGEELLGYQLQAGGPLARRVSSERFSALERAFRSPLAAR